MATPDWDHNWRPSVWFGLTEKAHDGAVFAFGSGTSAVLTTRRTWRQECDGSWTMVGETRTETPLQDGELPEGW